MYIPYSWLHEGLLNVCCCDCIGKAELNVDGRKAITVIKYIYFMLVLCHDFSIRCSMAWWFSFGVVSGRARALTPSRSFVSVYIIFRFPIHCRFHFRFATIRQVFLILCDVFLLFLPFLSKNRPPDNQMRCLHLGTYQIRVLLSFTLTFNFATVPFALPIYLCFSSKNRNKKKTQKKIVCAWKEIGKMLETRRNGTEQSEREGEGDAITITSYIKMPKLVLLYTGMRFNRAHTDRATCATNRRANITFGWTLRLQYLQGCARRMSDRARESLVP